MTDEFDPEELKKLREEMQGKKEDLPSLNSEDEDYGLKPDEIEQMRAELSCKQEDDPFASAPEEGGISPKLTGEFDKIPEIRILDQSSSMQNPFPQHAVGTHQTPQPVPSAPQTKGSKKKGLSEKIRSVLNSAALSLGALYGQGYLAGKSYDEKYKKLAQQYKINPPDDEISNLEAILAKAENQAHHHDEISYRPFGYSPRQAPDYNLGDIGLIKTDPSLFEEEERDMIIPYNTKDEIANSIGIYSQPDDLRSYAEKIAEKLKALKKKQDEDP